MKHMSLARRSAAVATAALLTLTLAACGEDDGDATGTDPATSESASAGESDAPAAAELPDWAPAIVTDGDAVTGLDFTDTPEPGTELEVATVTEGDGPAVEAGQTIEVNYYGSIYDGEKAFDSSFERGQTASFPIGVGKVIQGWDQGIPGIPVGSRIIMSIPSDLGYGDTGFPPDIPGGATLFFVVDIVSAS